MKWHQRDQHYWARECGQYFIERTISYAESRAGDWIYLAHYRARRGGGADDIYECISPVRRMSLESARGDCSAHLRAHHSENQPRRSAA